MGFVKDIIAFFRQNKEDALVPVKYRRDVSRVNEVITLLEKMPAGKAAADFLRDNGVSVVLDKERAIATFFCTLTVEDGAWRRLGSYIALNPLCDSAMLAASIVHEVQHARQAVAGVLRPKKILSPLDLARYIRFTEATAQTEAVYATFALKLAGDASLYDAFKKVKGYVAMFEAAEKYYAQDPLSLDDGRLKRRIFDAWFVRPAPFAYDIEVMDRAYPHMIDMALRYKGSPLPTGKLQASDLEALGGLVDGQVNYLTLPGFRPLDDRRYWGGFAARIYRQALEYSKVLSGDQSHPTAKTILQKKLGI